ncbi:GGDEF domain-containing protein [Candidatus Gracilibacteria bacterium]|nr:GGDEF domain-containing protein [Candidatus Gracilibacteria bacterium]
MTNTVGKTPNPASEKEVREGTPISNIVRTTGGGVNMIISLGLSKFGCLSQLIQGLSKLFNRDDTRSAVFDPLLRRRRRMERVLSPSQYLDTKDFLKKIEETLRRLYNTPGINIYLLKEGKDDKYYDIVTRSEIAIGKHFRIKESITQNNDIYVPIGNKKTGDGMVFQITGMPEKNQEEIIAGVREFWESGTDTLDLIHDRNRDELTGLYTKGFIDRYGISLDTEDDSTSYGIVGIDLVGFKYINDTFGQSKGDKALQVFGGIMKDTFKRQGELTIRQGGDEFAIVYKFESGTNSEEQKNIMENGMAKLRQKVNSINTAGGHHIGDDEKGGPIYTAIDFRYNSAIHTPNEPFSDVLNRANPPKTTGRKKKNFVAGDYSINTFGVN